MHFCLFYNTLELIFLIYLRLFKHFSIPLQTELLTNEEFNNEEINFNYHSLRHYIISYGR